MPAGRYGCGPIRRFHSAIPLTDPSAIPDCWHQLPAETHYFAHSNQGPSPFFVHPGR